MLNLDLEHTLNKLIHDRRASLICGLIILLMITITSLSFLAIPNKKANSLEQLENVTHKTYKKSESYPITQYHLFGEFLEPASTITSTAPSHLSLQAIFYSEDPALKSSALISENNEPGKVYYINNMIQGLKIQNILADKVILNDGSKLKTLELPIPKLEFAAPPENTLPKE